MTILNEGRTLFQLGCFDVWVYSVNISSHLQLFFVECSIRESRTWLLPVCETTSAGNKRTIVINQPTSKWAKTVDPCVALQIRHFKLLATENIEFHM